MENSLSSLTTAGWIWKANRSDHYPGFTIEPLDQDGTPSIRTTRNLGLPLPRNHLSGLIQQIRCYVETQKYIFEIRISGQT